MHYPLIMIEVNLNTPNENAAKDQLQEHYMHYPLIMVEVNLNTSNENAAKDQLRQPCMHCLTTIINLKPLLAENNPLGLVFWQSRVKASSALTLFNATFVWTTPQGWSFKTSANRNTTKSHQNVHRKLPFHPPNLWLTNTQQPTLNECMPTTNLFHHENKPFLSRE